MRTNIKKLTLTVVIILIILTNSFTVVGAPVANDIYVRLNDSLVLYVGSPIAYNYEKKTVIDSQNADIYPIEKEGRTLVPIRFISEMFGGKVSWNDETSTATLRFGRKNVQITLGSNQMLINDEKLLLDVSAESINGRMFIPLRRIAEDVLQKKVFYSQGLIIVSDIDNILDESKERNMIDQVIEWFNEKNNVNLFPFYNDGKYGYMDTSGNVVIKPQYDVAYNFSEGLAAVYVNGEFFYINKSGDVVIKASKCISVGEFKEGRAWLKKGSIKFPQYICIDKKGTVISDNKIYSGSDFSGGLSFVKFLNGESSYKSGYIDRSGILMFETSLETGSFYNGLASIGFNHNEGYIDKTGVIVINKIFDFAFDFSEGLALVSEKGELYYIDKQGNKVIKKESDWLSKFSEGMASIVINNKFGYINKYGDMIIEPIAGSKSCGDFSEGMAAIQIEDKWGYINRLGEMVIKPQFFTANEFKNGLAEVQIDDKSYYIDRKGNIIIPH